VGRNVVLMVLAGAIGMHRSATRCPAAATGRGFEQTVEKVLLWRHFLYVILAPWLRRDDRSARL